MSISALGTANPLASSLASQGLSASKTTLVENDFAAAVKTASAGGGKPDRSAVRAALNQRMSADVASGKLTQADADAVNKTLDTMEQAGGKAGKGSSSAGSATGKPVQGGKQGGGGGGGSDSSTKTELMRTTVVSGALETITITYTDGTTETETKASTDTDTDTDKTKTPTPAADSSAPGETPESGSLLDLLA